MTEHCHRWKTHTFQPDRPPHKYAKANEKQGGRDLEEQEARIFPLLCEHVVAPDKDDVMISEYAS